MKVRVIEKNGKYYSQYQVNSKFGPKWRDTYINANLGGKLQNEFDTLDEAKAECMNFASKHNEDKTVWQDEI